MAQGTIDASEIEEFADDIEDISVNKALTRAAERVGEFYVDVLTNIISNTRTSKGGTFDSRTSPYSPGGTNDSSDDEYHISENNAWTVDVPGPKMAVVYPKPQVRDRVRFFEQGTERHGTDGSGAPMYFYSNGQLIVVADWEAPTNKKQLDAFKGGDLDREEFLDYLFEYGTHGTVAGVDEQSFMERAFVRITSSGRVEEIYEEELEKEFQKAFEGAF